MQTPAAKAKSREGARRWRLANLARHNELARESYARRKLREGFADKERSRALMRNFGITLDDYHAMLARQGGGCAICGKKPSWRRLAVDHQHDDGALIRGLLCFTCNTKIGWLDTYADRIRAYLA
jgi:hypothetical protein